MAHLAGSHHATLSVGGAQEDVDFHTGTLGLRFIKKTVLYDGSLPIYHLYYSNANGDASSVVTTFPFRQAGIRGRRGTNQARELHLAVPATSLDFWSARLTERGVEVQDAEVLDQRRLLLRHPTGIEYALVGVEGDPRQGYAGSDVPAEHAIHGIHGVGVHVSHPENMVEFMNDSFFGKSLAEDGDRVVLGVGEPSRGGAVELVVNRTDDPGTWRFGEGTIHHFAWDAESLENQDAVKFEIEGVGYTDISELKDRTYFKSVYVRTPGGALFELAVTTPKGWATDESPNELGSAFQVPPQFEAQRDDILAQLEQIEV
jgi:glyoxalase family protein